MTQKATLQLLFFVYLFCLVFGFSFKFGFVLGGGCKGRVQEDEEISGIEQQDGKQNHKESAGAVVGHAFNPSTREAEAG